MSYEYSSSSQRLNFPTPFRVENIALIVSAACFLIGGLALLLIARSAITASNLFTLVPVAVGAGMIFNGCRLAARAFSQLRFFFGRGEPNSLAADNDHKNRRFRYNAEDLTEMVRQNALIYREPTGPINGLLYSWLDELTFAPDRIRFLTESYFGKLTIAAVVLVSFLFSVITVRSGEHRTLISIVFILMSVELIIPMLRNMNAGAQGINTRKIIILTLLGIFAPVVIALLENGSGSINLGFFAGNSLMFTIVLCSSLVFGLFIYALSARLQNPMNSSEGCVTQEACFNAHPKQLADEMEREMQRNWTEGIPNRIYYRSYPEVNHGESGEFNCNFLEETQPIPENGEQDMSLRELLISPKTVVLTTMDLLGVLFNILSAVCFFSFGSLVSADISNPNWINWLCFGIVFMLLGNLAIDSANFLWGQFKFRSKLIWLEFRGNWTRVKFDFGNQYVDKAKSERTTINVETATVRVWCVDVETVSFGKGDTRFVSSMIGNKDYAAYLGTHLVQFGEEQAVISAPTSSKDAQRVLNLEAINKVGGSRSQVVAQVASNLQQTLSALTGKNADQPPATKGRFCATCGTAIENEAQFCSECGTPTGKAS